MLIMTISFLLANVYICKTLLKKIIIFENMYIQLHIEINVAAIMPSTGHVYANQRKNGQKVSAIKLIKFAGNVWFLLSDALV